MHTACTYYDIGLLESDRWIWKTSLFNSSNSEVLENGRQAESV